MTCSLPSFVRSSASRRLLAFAGVFACAACSSPAPTPTAGAPSATIATAPGTPAPAAVSASGSPLSRLVPPARTSPRVTSSLAIDPGVSLGPIALGETLADLERAGFSVTRLGTDSTYAEVRLPASRGAEATMLRVQLCEGKIIEVWIDDLRKMSTPVTYAGKPVARTTKREELELLLGDCGEVDSRIGGNQQPCAKGGVLLGYGMGDFLQLRVVPPGFDRRDTYAIATDDGSPVTLTDAARTKMLEKMLMDRSISPYWHVDRPGRDPLRIVKTTLVPAVPMTMFGSPVVWIDPAEAKPGTAFLTITRLDATRTRATLDFTYPVEGVTGTIPFRHSSYGDEWQPEKGQVRER